MKTETPLVNRARLRRYALAVAEGRAHRFTRVGDEFFVRCEAQLKEFVRGHVQRLPSKGKTIQ